MVSIILFSVCLTSAVIWLFFLCSPVRWRMSEQWDPAQHHHITLPEWPSLSVIIPARNERKSLPLTLPSWLKQDYPESEIILVDDESDDGTAEYAKRITAQSGKTVHIIKGTKPPPGWTGKLWALEQGVRASSGEWLLFTDADILHCPDLWRGLVAKALAEQRAMVSLMAHLDTKGTWASLLIPAFVYFFYTMYPFEKVNNIRSRISAAAGGCILLSRHALEKIGGIAGHRDAWIDDIALAKRMKRAGFPVSLSLSRSAVSIRSYGQLQDVWKMVARTAFTQLRCSWFYLTGTITGLLVLFLAPLIGISAFFINTSLSFTAILSFGTIIIMTVTYIPAIRFFRLNTFQAFTLPFAGILYTAMTISSAIDHLAGRRTWRGVRTETRKSEI
ncbi:MAG: glycosyltransferase [Candidatus Loosdrechtia sp.]|uniref:glycosyltransferase n=1 Tax=Candidatus Loosdrechtia sp. TaxID=3101272 RepID=UPI003A69BAA3|nr:MAG: glycosyltransferase [Candidatus Jettenia sp. AMX2]